MKTRLVIILALVFILSFVGTAFADSGAKPFSDVPQSHWAYKAVVQLARDGIIDGSVFEGNKSITRYEMAKIVAKAMAKQERATAEDKVLIEQLAVEFKQELANLNVRVGNQEKVDRKLSLGGTLMLKIDYTRHDNANSFEQTIGGAKLALFGSYQINDNWRYEFSAEKTRDLTAPYTTGTMDTSVYMTPNAFSVAGDTGQCKGMAVSGNIGHLTGLTAGTFHYEDGWDGYGYQFFGGVTGVQLAIGDRRPFAPGLRPVLLLISGKLEGNDQAMAYEGRPWYGPYANTNNGYGLFVNGDPTMNVADFSINASKATRLNMTAIRVTSPGHYTGYFGDYDAPVDGRNFYAAGFHSKLDKDHEVKVMTGWSTYPAATDNKAWMVQLGWGDTRPFGRRPGEHDWQLAYFHNGAQALIYNNYNTAGWTSTVNVVSIKGIFWNYEYYVAPNMQLQFRFINMKGFGTSEGYDNKWYRFQINYSLF